MEAVKGILVVLAAVFVAADCLFSLSKFEPLSEQMRLFHSECREKLKPCISILGSKAGRVYTSMGLKFLFDDIDEICTVFQPTKDCLKKVPNDCVSKYPASIVSYLSAAEYVCSEGGRALLREARNSPCYSDRDQLDAAAYSMMSCYTSSLDSQDPASCVEVARHMECIVQAIAKQCEQAYGTVVGELSKRVHARDHPECSAGSSSVHQKGGYELFIKTDVQ